MCLSIRTRVLLKREDDNTFIGKLAYSEVGWNVISSYTGVGRHVRFRPEHVIKPLRDKLLVRDGEVVELNEGYSLSPEEVSKAMQLMGDWNAKTTFNRIGNTIYMAGWKAFRIADGRPMPLYSQAKYTVKFVSDSLVEVTAPEVYQSVHVWLVRVEEGKVYPDMMAMKMRLGMHAHKMPFLEHPSRGVVEVPVLYLASDVQVEGDADVVVRRLFLLNPLEVPEIYQVADMFTGLRDKVPYHMAEDYVKVRTPWIREHGYWQLFISNLKEVRHGSTGQVQETAE